MSIFAVIFQLAKNVVDVRVFKKEVWEDHRFEEVFKDLLKGWSGGDVFDLIGDVDPTDEDGDIRMGDSTGVAASLDGEIFSGGKKCRESNISDSDNTRDGGKTVAEIGDSLA
nr:hypothetical protein [Tanacetum cinerariifolium]